MRNGNTARNADIKIEFGSKCILINCVCPIGINVHLLQNTNTLLAKLMPEMLQCTDDRVHRTVTSKVDAGN
jgi:hypothetical protein